VSIRFQLLLVALTTLILPWAGCRYARELETALRVSQEEALEASAGTIAHALSAEPERVFRNPGASEPFAAERGDLYVFPLRTQPLLDGYREDWDVPADPLSLPGSHDLGARLQAGSTDRYLFLYVEVDDSHYVPEPRDSHPERDRFDRIDLTLQESDGALRTYIFATSAPGLIEARSIIPGEDGADRLAAEPRIQGFWLQTSHGFQLEARLPLSLVGPRLWIQAEDGTGRKAAPLDPAHGGRLFMTTPGLGELLATFITTGTRASVVDANRLKLGEAGSLEPAPIADDAAETESWSRPRCPTASRAQASPPRSRAVRPPTGCAWARVRISRSSRQRPSRSTVGSGVPSSFNRPAIDCWTSETTRSPASLISRCSPPRSP
jgi:two-component system sensor histidine kinase ChvG